MGNKNSQDIKPKWWKISFSTIISLSALFFTIYQFRINNNRAEAQINDIKSEREMRISENRPYFSYDGFTQYSFPNDSIQFLLKFKNIGERPAYDATSIVRIIRTDSSKVISIEKDTFAGSNPVNKNVNIDLYVKKVRSDFKSRKCFFALSIFYQDILTKSRILTIFTLKPKQTDLEAICPLI